MAVEESPGTPAALSPFPDQRSRIERRPTVRKLREFVVFEPELDHVSLLNSLTAAFFSAASASLAFPIGLITTALMQDTISERAQGMLWIGVPGGLLLALGFAIAACWALKTKGSASGQLKSQAIDIEQAAPAPLTPVQLAPDTARSPTESAI